MKFKVELESFRVWFLPWKSIIDLFFVISFGFLTDRVTVKTIFLLLLDSKFLNSGYIFCLNWQISSEFRIYFYCHWPEMEDPGLTQGRQF